MIALNWAYENGLDPKATVYSGAPAILFNNRIRAENIYAPWSPAELKRFRESVMACMPELYNSAVDICGLQRHQALLVLHEFVNGLDPLYKIRGLLENPVNFPLLCLQLKTHSKKDRILNPTWSGIFSDKLQIETLTADCLTENLDFEENKAVKLSARLRQGGMETLIYRLLLPISKVTRSLNLSKSHGLIFGENELLIEAVSSMMARGFSFERMQPVAPRTRDNLSEDAFLLKLKPLHGEFATFFSFWCSDSITEVLSTNLYKRICQNLNSLELYTQIFLENKDLNKADFVLAGPISSIQGRGLAAAAENLQIPIATFHHGLTHEFSNYTNIQRARYDSSLSNLTFVHNEEAKRVLERNPYKRAKIVPVGLPKRYHRVSNGYKINARNNEILYLSTNVRSGNTGAFVHKFQSDYDFDKCERDFVIRVLGNLPHRVTFKPYPEERRRYTEKTLAEDGVQSLKNVEVTENNCDARFLLDRFSVFVSSGATSTLGWLLCTQKPLVYLHWPNHIPLLDSLIDEFKNGTFFFDSRSLSFEQDLKKLLSSDIREIEQLWDAKRSGRDLLYSRYVQPYAKSSGELISDWMAIFLKDWQKKCKCDGHQ